MNIKKQILKLEEDLTEIKVGLIRLIKPIQEHELFFIINQINTYKFLRIDDIVVEGEFYDYSFSRYEAYDQFSNNYYRFISNKSTISNKKKEQHQLFSDESNIKYLLNMHQDVEYILTNSEILSDFSLILVPENLMFQIQDYSLSSEEELYQLIQYYE